MYRALTFLVLTAALAVGCSGADKPPPYANVSGSVTLNGKPIDKGIVVFATDGRPPAIIDILNGTYTGMAMVGPNKVTISSKRKSAAAQNLPPDVLQRMRSVPPPPGGGGGQPQTEVGMEEVIPPEWNTKSNQTRVIEAGTTNKLDFEIRTK